MKLRQNSILLIVLSFLTALISCSEPLEWPDSPLYEFDYPVIGEEEFDDLAELKNELIGHYAHFDVVAYEDTTTRTTMRSFIISYGFTDFYLEGDKLMMSNSYVHSEQKMSRKGAKSEFSEKAVKAISPKAQEVKLMIQDGKWLLFRPATPSLLGIKGDPMKKLSRDPNDPALTDPDEDGNPGVTVKISVGKFFNGEIYITRREIFNYYLSPHTNGYFSGYVVDQSEQFVVGASKKILNQPSNSVQHPDNGLSPILLVPISEDIDTREELMAIRDTLFPEEPAFYEER